MMFAGGVLELVDAFTLAGWQRKRSLRLLAGVIYGFAGALVVFDPLLVSVSLSLALGTLLCFVGALRIGFGFQHHDEKARGWIVVAGTFTLIAGAVVLIAWPGISLWPLGAILTVDLILQGWSFTALGLAYGRVASTAQLLACGSSVTENCESRPPNRNLGMMWAHVRRLYISRSFRSLRKP